MIDGGRRPVVLAGDLRTQLAALLPDSVDSVVTDPPYGLAPLKPRTVTEVMRRWASGDLMYVPEVGAGFMGNGWDRFVPPPGAWERVLRVLKPGGHAAVFAGSRTQDLMGLSLRLAGFDIRETMLWMYGTGMPKSKSTLKPGYEPILLARKPFRGSETANVATWGVGGLFTEACRVPFISAEDEAESKGKNQHADFGTRQGQNKVYGDTSMMAAHNYNPPGRWPSNVTLTHDDDCGDRCVPGCPAGELDAQSDRGMGLGGASRFFYTTKASSAERPSYVDADGTVVMHPTVKPLDLIRWQCRLVTPPGGTVLDPFAGSGTTGEAAMLEGFDAILVEEEPRYLPLIEQRLDRHRAGAA